MRSIVVLALDTEHHSSVYSVHMAVRYNLAAGDFGGAYRSRRDAENTFQMLEELGTSFSFVLVE